MRSSIFGKFSVKETPSEIVVKQTNYLSIFVKLFVLGILIFGAIIQIQHRGAANLIGDNKANYIVLIFPLIFLYFFLKNITPMFKRHKLIINLIERSINYNRFEIRAERISYADVGKVYYGKICRYYLIIYEKDGSDYLPAMTDGVAKELTGENIFEPVALSKKFMIFLANEVNKLTSGMRRIDNKSDKLEIAGNVYLIIATIISVPLFLVITYAFIYLYSSK